MKVAVLQQYLRNLLEPLRASNASAKALNDLETTCNELEPFRERDVSALAEFLRRAKTYEEEGHWPPAKGAGRASKKTRPEPINLQDLANRLRTQAGSANIQAELADIEKLTVPQIRALIRDLKIGGKFQKKPEGLEMLRLFLQGSVSPSLSHTPASAPFEGKLARIVETLKSLKAKADGPDAPFDEIEAELHSLEAQLDAKEALSAAKTLGIIRTITTRADALEAIRRKVLEVKLARESIAY